MMMIRVKQTGYIRSVTLIRGHVSLNMFRGSAASLLQADVIGLVFFWVQERVSTLYKDVYVSSVVSVSA